jgi:hypothetical protein
MLLLTRSRTLTHQLLHTHLLHLYLIRHLARTGDVALLPKNVGSGALPAAAIPFPDVQMAPLSKFRAVYKPA